MKALFWETTFVLVIGAFMSVSFARSADTASLGDQHEEHEGPTLNKNNPCPIHCKCSRILAQCTRLEIRAQKFGDHITVINVDDIIGKHPIILSNMMFKDLGLKQVTEITIVNNIISNISPTAFMGLRELKTVTLTANNIKTLHPDIFAHNKKLAALTITHNPLILSNNVSTPYFINSASIRMLVISNNNITSIPKTTFSKMTNLLYIHLEENNIHDIDVGVFSYLQNLEYVDLSHNFIESIPEDLFTNNSKLRTVLFGDNYILPIYYRSDTVLNELKLHKVQDGINDDNDQIGQITNKRLERYHPNNPNQPLEIGLVKHPENKNENENRKRTKRVSAEDINKLIFESINEGEAKIRDEQFPTDDDFEKRVKIHREQMSEIMNTLMMHIPTNAELDKTNRIADKTSEEKIDFDSVFNFVDSVVRIIGLVIMSIGLFITIVGIVILLRQRKYNRPCQPTYVGAIPSCPQERPEPWNMAHGPEQACPQERPEPWNMAHGPEKAPMLESHVHPLRDLGKL